jgi:eukaryotic-like serine/threonine-protein kinase
MPVVGGAILNPLEQLSGLTLEGGWVVGARIPKPADQSGGYFSVGYECVSSHGAKAYLKALDLSAALREPDLLKALQRLGDGVQCEIELLETCRRMDRVVTALAFGTVREIDGQSLTIPIPYIIFERASGTARGVVKASARPSHSWCFQTLHQVTTGLRQLHGQMISHSDLKPSNVLLFDENRGAKVADLGRSVRQGRTVWYDSLDWPGDYTYAPPEVSYGFIHGEFVVRRLAADLFSLGSLASVMICSVPMNTLIMDQMPSDLKPPKLKGTFTGTFEQVLPHLRTAFLSALDQIRSEIHVDAPYRDQIMRIIGEWCEPDPRERGHPIARSMLGATGNSCDLERYVSELPNLAAHARMFDKRRSN